MLTPSALLIFKRFSGRIAFAPLSAVDNSWGDTSAISETFSETEVQNEIKAKKRTLKSRLCSLATVVALCGLLVACDSAAEDSGLDSTSSVATTVTTTTIAETETDATTTTETTSAATTTSKPTTTTTTTTTVVTTIPEPEPVDFSLKDIPEFDGTPYVTVNDNIPYFSENDKSITYSFETYSNLDSLARCGVAYACVGQDLMPTEERGAIGSVKPSGWHSIKYDNVDGKYLYNRCHLIGYQLSGENTNGKNLITGTRYLNMDGMLPFENMVADYVKETNNHVLYRLTPIFDGNNLLATGVLMEGYSVEDNGNGICYNVFCYNAQPDITIDYATGDSESEYAVTETTTTAKKTEPTQENNQAEQQPVGSTYILNTNTKKFHNPSCSSVGQMNDSNKQEYTGSGDDLISMGYDPCKRCNP